MHVENQSELFIRLLADALNADRLGRTAIGSSQDRAVARRSMQLARSDHKLAMHAAEPLDCVQLMSLGPNDR